LRKEQISRIEALQIDVLEQGRRLYDRVPMEEIRAQRQTDLERLDPGVRRLINPHIYHVSLTKELWNLKQTLIQNATKERRSQPNLDHD
jgi:nicotinate phosphoribosyltransferase